jgi:hypothetical protein
MPAEVEEHPRIAPIGPRIGVHPNRHEEGMSPILDETRPLLNAELHVEFRVSGNGGVFLQGYATAPAA